ncbi:MAG: malto-oligosyltrehalose synthase, partial [Trueperaceae bacterium]|nr:malto-oligosyltrehalose synthase [Trueperaceae bacterium]
VRIDHIDGLFDPHSYLEHLRELGARQVWVEKILAPGETMPETWYTSGTTGYEFLNDAMGVLTDPGGEIPIKRIYRRFVDDVTPYDEEVHNSKRLVMETSLSGELFRLANALDRLSEADYHTRDFTLESLREALAEVAAAFPRYRTYLPHNAEEAAEVIRDTIARAKRRNPATELSVYDFIERSLVGEVREDLEEARRAFVGRFQQYTAPVAAKGVEDTTFYRYLPLVALNEVGGEPDHFGTAPHAFHARAQFRAYRYPDNLLATATHDHKRGEDTRMRLIALAEMPDLWQRTLGLLDQEVRRQREASATPPFTERPSRNDEYLFYQLLVGLYAGADKDTLADRLVQYMEKAVREAKLRSSWLNPDEGYERVLTDFVRAMTDSRRVRRIIGPLSAELAACGFQNTLAQTILKITTPGVPDFYQGSELFDLSLVDPDNRKPVDYERRRRMLDELEPLLNHPEPEHVRNLYEHQTEFAKLYLTSRLLRFRSEHADLFAGEYRVLEPSGDAAEHILAYAREAEREALIVVIPRFPATPAGRHTLPLPGALQGRDWHEVLTGERVTADTALDTAARPLPFTVLYSKTEW